MEWVRDYKQILDDKDVIKTIAISNEAIISSEYSRDATVLDDSQKVSIEFTAISFETLGFEVFVKEDGKRYFSHAFECRLAVLDMCRMDELVITAIDGLLADRIPEVRLFLEKIPFTRSETEDWTEILKETIFHAFLKLIRKRNGWEDVQSALKAIQLLKEHQDEVEKKFLKNLDSSISTATSC